MPIELGALPEDSGMGDSFYSDADPRTVLWGSGPLSPARVEPALQLADGNR